MRMPNSVRCRVRVPSSASSLKMSLLVLGVPVSSRTTVLYDKSITVENISSRMIRQSQLIKIIVETVLVNVLSLNGFEL